ncbi:MAG: FIST C-terminal domain-containing protein [Steroidobacteraceae bacterium]
MYERYLGEEAEGLPATALLYPLRVWDPAYPSHDVVRTVLAIDRGARSMIFAGDIPEGHKAQLMRGELGRLVEGATEAAAQAKANHADVNTSQALALLVSCVGRRLLMGQRSEEEIQAVRELLPDTVAMLGMYSYGEIAPHPVSGLCELHNQTMTITLISEAGGDRIA